MNLEITKMAHTGHGVAMHNEKEIHVLGSFPGDSVSVSIYKTVGDISYAHLEKILKPSKLRAKTDPILPVPSHAPWENLKEDAEQEIKKALVNELFDFESNISEHPELRSGYRNKSLYSFTNTKDGLAFAMFERGNEKFAVQQQNILVHPKIQSCAQAILNFLKDKKATTEDIKYLSLRYSYHTNTVVAHFLMYTQSRKALPFKKSELEKLIAHIPSLQGILVSHSERGRRQASTTKDFYDLGDINIIEQVNDKLFRYHPSSFFQIYPLAFSSILKDIEDVLADIDTQELTLFDLFSGIGIIGISIHSHFKSVVCVEHSPLSLKYTEHNAKQNKVDNIEVFESSVEDKSLDITQGDVVLVDPPRSGLSREVINTIKSSQPSYLIYISCNPETQARDLELLKDQYQRVFSRVYNLFPSTHHIEHLIILKRS